ncbi:MAG: thioredoxin family protein [Cellvibrionales bacterium]|nr:thioredoxin family protein [Cellvibrionales bacterium]
MIKLNQWLYLGVIMVLAGSLISGCDKKKPYDGHKEAFKRYEKTLLKTQHPKKTLVVFGANWCKYCVELDDAMHEEPLKSYIKKYFNVVKVDVGEQGRNQKMLQLFDYPTKKGLPAIVIVNANQEIDYISSDGRFRSVRNSSSEDIKRFLSEFVRS